MAVGAQAELEIPLVPSGDYIQTDMKNALRMGTGSDVVLRQQGTTPQMLQAGAGSMGTATGSTATATFTTTYTAVPYVTATANYDGNVALTGSAGISVAGVAVGSAVLLGPSGVGFNWQAVGNEYA